MVACGGKGKCAWKKESTKFHFWGSGFAAPKKPVRTVTGTGAAVVFAVLESAEVLMPMKPIYQTRPAGWDERANGI